MVDTILLAIIAVATVVALIIKLHDRLKKARSAVITAELKNFEQRSHYELHIHNSGASEARNVTVRINEKPISELQNIKPETPEVDTIGSHSSFSYQWPYANNPSPKLLLEIEWNDDSEKKKLRYFKTVLMPSIAPT